MIAQKPNLGDLIYWAYLQSVGEPTAATPLRTHADFPVTAKMACPL